MEIEPNRKKRREQVPHDTPIDELARRGYMKSGDMPGTDTFDDGLDERGRLKPGSTTGESSGSYMEDIGPINMRRGNTLTDEEGARADKLTIGDSGETEDNDMYGGSDAAAAWLRENDPRYKGTDDEHREAA